MAKVLIVHHSLSGNTKAADEAAVGRLEEMGELLGKLAAEG